MGEYLKTATILYVEDNEEVRLGYVKTLKRYAKTLFVASDGQEGLTLFKTHLPDIVISDIKMPSLSGIEMAQQIKSIKPDQIIVFTTAYSDAHYTLPSLELHVHSYLLKPIDKKTLQTTINELSKRVSLERQMQEQQQMLTQILDHQSNITIVTDLKTIQYASRSFWEMLYNHDWNTFFEMYDSLLDLFVSHSHYIHGKTRGEFLKRYHDSDDDMRLVSIITASGPTAFYINIDKVKHISEELYILSLTDVTSLQTARLNAVQHATYDRLTKLYNRYTFEEYFERELSRVKRYERPLCVALLDIDHFKRFNDTFGHLIGDEVLVLLAQTLSHGIRSTDTFARWGGEEFVLMMSETDLDKAHKVLLNIQTLIASIQHPIAGGITLSIGYTKALPSDSYQSLFGRCDEALYRAKNSGRNTQVCL